MTIAEMEHRLLGLGQRFTGRKLTHDIPSFRENDPVKRAQIQAAYRELHARWWTAKKGA